MKNFKQFVKTAKEKTEKFNVAETARKGYEIGVTAAAAALDGRGADKVLNLINSLSNDEMSTARGCAIDTAKKYFGSERANLMFAETSKEEFTYNLIKLYATLFEKNEKFFNAV